MDARVLLGVLCCCAALAAQEPQEERPATEPPGAEGALQNDAFLPIDAGAERAFAAGDAALAQARGALQGRDAERLYGEAFDAWRGAVAGAPPGALVWHPSQTSSAEKRLAESAEVALRGRLAGLDADEAARWAERVGGLAAAELAAAGRDRGALSAAAGRHPGTPAAVRAELALADLLLEEGRLSAARGWVERAAAGADERARSAVEARRAWLAAALPGAGAPAGPPPDAQRLVPLGSAPLEDPFARFVEERGPPISEGARGVRPGAARLADGRVAVQTHSRVHVVALAAGGPRVEAVFDPAELLLGRLERPPEPTRGDGPAGWPLLPAAAQDRLFLVQGRAERVDFPGLEGGAVPNALLCVRPAPARGAGPAADELPELLWAVSGDRWLGADGAVRRVPGLSELAEAELQPGPLVAGDAVVVQARTLDQDASAWLCAFDLLTGELRFARFLAKGSDLAGAGRRFGPGRIPELAAQPPAAAGPHVFACTGLGTASLVDPLDGRVLWSLKLRRRAPADPGWSGDRPPVASGEDGLLVLCAPADSDRLYTLRADGPVPPAGGVADLFPARFPLPIGEAEQVLGLDREGLVLAGRPGGRRAVFRVGPGGAGRVEAAALGEAERFAGPGLLAGRRALALSNRALYLFDLERELYLVDTTGVGDPSSPAELVLAGDLVLAVGTRSVAAFQSVR